MAETVDILRWAFAAVEASPALTAETVGGVEYMKADIFYNGSRHPYGSAPAGQSWWGAMDRCP